MTSCSFSLYTFISSNHIKLYELSLNLVPVCVPYRSMYGLGVDSLSSYLSSLTRPSD